MNKMENNSNNIAELEKAIRNNNRCPKLDGDCGIIEYLMGRLSNNGNKPEELRKIFCESIYHNLCKYLVEGDK